MAAFAFSLVIALSPQESIQASPEVSRPLPLSLLPQTIGIGIASDKAILVAFDEPMDPASVEAAVHLTPAEDVALSWNDDRSMLSIEPVGRWQTDETYLVVVDQSATSGAGSAVPAQRFAFSTQTAPTVSDFHVSLAPADLPEADASQPVVRALSVEQELEPEPNGALTPGQTAREVSTSSSVRVRFSAPMDRSDVESNFSIAPEVAGDLAWEGGDLVFTPTERMELGGRYTVSLLGAHDRLGNPLGGKASFSFLVREGPQMVKTSPEASAEGTEPATVEMWFNQPMDVDATNTAFGLKDTTTGALVAGRLNWNEDATQIVYSPDRPLAGGRTFEVALGAGAVDADGNPLSVEWSFTTKAAPVVPAAPREATAGATQGGAPPAAPAPAVMGASGLEGYALSQINNARASYGLPPLALDYSISAVAAGHAWDQLNRGYYSHYTLGSGAGPTQRLAAAGIGFHSAGENACYAEMGLGAQGTMNWCHGVFMSEPWPGYANHIGNILSSRYTRVGVGVADNGLRVVITWDFAN